MKDLNFVKPKKGIGVKRAVVIAVALLAGGVLVWVGQNSSKELVVSGAEGPAAPGAPPAPEIKLLEKIQEGIALLEKSEPLKYETTSGRVHSAGSRQASGSLIRKQIALAILDKKTGEVFEHRVWVRENEIQNYRQTGILNLEPVLLRSNLNDGGGLTSTEEDLRIVINWWNSFNTDYGFPDNPNLVVVANKYLWLSSNLATLPERSKNKYTEIIYVPYSGGLHTAELIEAGKKYVEENINIAYDQLENGRVMSRHTPGHLVTSGVDKDFIKNIMIVEHIDPDAFKNAGDKGKDLAERVLVIIGANKERSYRYTSSSAGASGLAQFIKPTYQNIVSKYPQAKMINDYTLGMANHVNAAKAMVLFFDEHKKALANNISRKDIAMSLGITEEMLAAAYNGGPRRVTSSINKFGLAWISGQLNLSSSSRILRRETLDYVSKFRAIKSLDIF